MQTTTFTIIEGFVYLFIIAMIGLAIFVGIWQFNNPDEYCQMARRFNTVEELPAYCTQNESYPKQKLEIEVTK